MPPHPDRAARAAARAVVDRRIAEILDPMPCFCTPDRPELGRLPWCAKHWVLSRLDRADLAAGCLATLEALNQQESLTL